MDIGTYPCAELGVSPEEYIELLINSYLERNQENE